MPVPVNTVKIKLFQIIAVKLERILTAPMLRHFH